MTVWPDADAARIDPKILETLPPTCRELRLIQDAFGAFNDGTKSEAWKLGYLVQTLKILQEDIRFRYKTGDWQ